MTDYEVVHIELTPCNETLTDILAYYLSELGYDSFVPTENGLDAFIPAQAFSIEALKKCLAAIPQLEINGDIEISHHTEKGQDWNEEWEKHYFQPIIIGKEVCIHSTFHKDIPQCQYDIIIDPKMAFGTGHHATTSLMISQLLTQDLKGKKVVDMGCGTGILSIVALMRGATKMTGVEIDPFAAENARENLVLNHASQGIEIITGDAEVLRNMRDVDLFLANINRNIITGDMEKYVSTLNPGATVFFSGFYQEDIPIVKQKAEGLGLTYVSHMEKDNWVAVKFTKA